MSGYKTDIRRLVESQQKSDAVETLLTLALIIFAQGQLTATLYSQSMHPGELFLMIGGILLGSSIIIITLLFSWNNLVSVWKKEMPCYEEKWEFIT